MNKNEFFNVAKTGTIRQAVADMMSSDKHLSKYNNEAYYEVEDAICWLIEDHMYDIYNFVERESIKEDFESHLDNYFSERISDEYLDEMVDAFIDKQTNDDSLGDMRSQTIDDICETFAKRAEVLKLSVMMEEDYEDIQL